MGDSQGHQGAVVHRTRDAYPISRIAPRLRVDPPSIAAVERRRVHLWTVAALLLLALSVAVVLLFVGEGTRILPEVPALRWSFLAMSAAFILYVVDQERRLRGLTTLLIEERVLTTSLQGRITDLSLLTKVGRVVNSVLTLEEVLEVILTSAFELTGAVSGSVMLRDGDVLRVAASAGDSRAPVGATVDIGSGAAGWVAKRSEPLLITGRLTPPHGPRRTKRRRPAGSSVVAPLVAGGELRGVLSVERPPEAEPFSDAEMRSVALFAEHAATAVHNAERYGEQRRTVEQLADSLERRSEFVATMVHELRTPLTVILGFAAVLEQQWEQLSPEQRVDALGSIRTQGERLRSMVGEVLRAASVDAGAELRRDPMDLRELLDEVRRSIGTLVHEREGVERPLHLSGTDQPLVVVGDRDALYRVFENLMENAVKYSPAGAPVEVAAERRRAEVHVTVRDHGPGIPESELGTVFERFRRSTAAITAGSVGLGLYIVRQLVLSHGGRVWASSDAGQGATFTVALPLRSHGDEAAAEVTPRTGGAEESVTAGSRTGSRDGSA